MNRREGRRIGQARICAGEMAMQSTGAVRPQPERNLTQGLSLLVERARLAHPRFAVDGDKFARHLALRAAASDLHVEDLYLAFACASRDRAALALFEERHLARVGQWI